MQNRVSQRAFRQRKEAHVQNVQQQLQELHNKHQSLLQTYSNQANVIMALKAGILEMSEKLVRTGNGYQIPLENLRMLTSSDELTDASFDFPFDLSVPLTNGTRI